MSSTVQVGKMELTSNQPAAEMVESLTPREESKDKPKVLVDGGVKVKDSEPPSEASEAARKLGELGGRAAAEARKAKKAEMPEAKEEPEPEAKPEAKAKASEEPDESEEQPEGKAPDKPGHPRHDPQARIAKLAQQRREAEQRARELEERLARVEEAAGLRQKQPAPQDVRQAPDDVDPPKPKLDDYETYEEFTEALAEWKADRRIDSKLRELRQQHEAESKAGETVKAIETFRERTSKYLQANPDAAERVAQIAQELRPTIAMPPGQQPGPQNVLADEILQSPNPPALMLYLADHPEEYDELLRAPDPRTLWRGVAVIESLLSGRAQAAPERRPSNAPPPLRPVQPSPAAGSQEITGDIPFEDFVKRRKQKG